MPQAAPLRRTRRKTSDLANLPRTSFGSNRVRAMEIAAPPNHPPLSSFAPSAVLAWISNYLKYVLHKKHPFVDASQALNNAIYALGGDDGSEVRVAVAGDWGTGTDESDAVGQNMRKFEAAYTIHIGDVYYVGDEPEIGENCLGKRNPQNNYDPVVWPMGRLGSFAMNGNHEMYANGNAYFEEFLPTLGLIKGDGTTTGQHTSFFCLENKFWRIIAIDTGYNSIGLPLLSQIPGVNDIPGVGGNCKLQQPLIDWLTNFVKPSADPRGLVILSHHQYYSGFQQRYRKPAQQLFAAGVTRPVIWFWGHEHRLAGYGLEGSDDLKAYGRCVGHGGMPVDLGPIKHDPQPVFYDDRVAPTQFGMNGHVNLSFSGNKLTATYIDLKSTPLFTESWTVDASGALTLGPQTKLINDPNFHF